MKIGNPATHEAICRHWSNVAVASLPSSRRASRVLAELTSNRGRKAVPEADFYAWYVVAVLMFAYTVSFIDRQILSLLVQPIRRDLGISDTQFSLLAGFAFALFYATLGIPIARLADRTNRRFLIMIGVVVWSVMTAACGLAKSYWQLFLARMGVGAGEATLSPAAYSMISDYFAPHKLPKAIGVYAMGLYIGAGLALLAGSAVISVVNQAGTIDLPVIGTVYPWQLTFFVVALPGLLVLAFMATVKEPARREHLADGTTRPSMSQPVPWAELWGFFRSNMRIIVAHFLGYLALGMVISAYLVWVPEWLRRTYGIDIAESGVIYGVCLLVFGSAGPYAGGWLAERLARRGYRDAEFRASVIGACVMLAFGILTPLAPTVQSAVIMLAILTFLLSFPQGLAPTILQLIAPNRMRAQVSAIKILFAVLAGYTLGPTCVALITDYVFGYDEALRYSLAIVSGVLTPVGIGLLAYGMKPYRERP